MAPMGCAPAAGSTKESVEGDRVTEHGGDGRLCLRPMLDADGLERVRKMRVRPTLRG